MIQVPSFFIFCRLSTHNNTLAHSSKFSPAAAVPQVAGARPRPSYLGVARNGQNTKKRMYKSILKELWQDDECKDEGADDLRRLKVEVIHLRAKLRGEHGILNLLEAAAVDVPNAALPDVS